MGLMKVALVVMPMVIMLRYPFVQDLTVDSVSYQSGRFVVVGTLKVVFTDDAWIEFGYKDGNFFWFDKWWRDEAPGTAFGPFRLVSMSWTLLEHAETYDRLAFVMVLEKR